MKTVMAIVLLCCAVSLAAAGVQIGNDQITMAAPRWTAVFSADDGSLLRLTQTGKQDTLLRGGEQGLWHARFLDNTSVDAIAFHAGAGDRSFSAQRAAGGQGLTLTYQAPELSVTVTVSAAAEGLDFTAKVTPKQKTLLDFALPGRLRFDPAQVTRFISPLGSGTSVGIACNAKFFQEQPQDKPNGWRPRMAGTQGYVALYGAPLDQRADQDAPVALTVTARGTEWLGQGLAGRLKDAQAVVNRPPTRAQADLVLVDSANGPYFSASHLGGTGYLWRLGGGVGDKDHKNAVDMVLAAVERLAASAPAGRTKIGLLALTRGPEKGGWSDVPVQEWSARFRQLRAAGSGKVQVVEIPSAAEMLKAASSGEYLTILNPYGEWAPSPDPGGMPVTADAVGKYVRAGGNWFEVGGYPFFYEMRPVRYLNMSTGYPPAFADFLHLDSVAGAASVYGIQPQTHAPWAAAKDSSLIFIPGRLGFGGDEKGGYCDRAFSAYIPAGQTWQPPLVRLAVGNTGPQDLVAYSAANAFTRRLQDKMSPQVLDKFRNAVMVFYAGNARDKTDHLSLLPMPTLIHFSDYLKGGFDKQYPDHLPPNANFGTPAEMRQFFDEAHKLGHMVMPYTNPTWWCDHPKGPTFEREGDAPLLKNLDGKPNYERYAANDGWTITFWHPAVQAANRKTVQQFTNEYPVDVLFQDQCGARGWLYDTNPASPTPYAYSEGLISQVDEDCRIKPLSTEGGWDRVVNYESQLCGMTWSIVPTEGGPTWTRALKYEYPAETWSVFPVAEYIAHDKTMMLHHDLGQFVTNRETLAWTLGLGFGLSYRTGASELTRDNRRQWLLWLDRLQKSVCAPYIGEPVKGFDHDRGGTGDEGVIRAGYGPVNLTANLEPKTVTENGKTLAPYGFYATAAGMVAANLQRVGSTEFGDEGVSFVTQGTAKQGDLWVYAPAEQAVAVEAPSGMKGAVTVAVDGQAAVKCAVTDGTLSLRLPSKSTTPRTAPPAELAGKAPKDWPGEKPAIGVLDFAGVTPNWTSIKPADWVDALSNSKPAKEQGVPVRRLTTVPELMAALQAGPTKWLAILNPYGEQFPTTGPGKWRESLDAIRSYVNHGGVWWEIAGYSFHQAIYPLAAGGWGSESVGPSGMGYLGLPVGGGEVDQTAEALRVPAEGRAWLGEGLANNIEKAMSAVNRGAPRGMEDPGHLTLVAGAEQDFIAGYRLEGWGWLWRGGGFDPNPQVIVPTVAASLEHIYNNPAAPVVVGGVRYLWHAKLQAQ